MMLSNVRPLAAATMPLLSIRNVSKQYGQGEGALKALDDVSLDLQANEFCTLLGPSGCGKTTLLRIIAGFAAPTSGEVVLDGEDLLSFPPNRRPVNTVFQSYALFSHLTIEQNIAFGLERLRWKRSEIRARTSQMLELVQLVPMARRLPKELSGGQQQRVALARALAPKPRLLLLDEPLSALDLKLRRGMQIELKRLQRETGITFVLVTHDQEEALFMSDRIAVIGAGRLLQTGTPREIYDKPKSRFVADFIGEANVLPGHLFNSGSDFVAIRPERIQFSATRTDQADLSGLVAEVNYLGSCTGCVIALSSGESIKVSLPAPHDSVSVGQKVFCKVTAEAVLCLEN